MIVIDPILKTRNAASSVSYEKLALFKKKAKEFLRKPSERYFDEPEIGKTYLKQKYRKNLFILTLEAKAGKRDVVGSKLLKAFGFIKSELAHLGFSIDKSGWNWNKKKHALFWFVFGSLELPDTRTIEGPPAEMKDHVKIFRKKYRKCFLKDGKVFAVAKVEKVSPDDAIDAISKKEYFKEKAGLLKTEKYI
jgi:tRNA nucleotidyltransferase (CCA-adding enzyme)